jgi:hypothetical protein
MLGIKKTIYIVFVIFFLSSCVQKSPSVISDEFINLIEDKKIAVVIFSVAIVDDQDIPLPSIGRINLKWNKVTNDKGENISEESDFTYLGIIYPGKYELTDISYTQDVERDIYSNKRYRYNNSFAVENSLNFTVKGGEVIYLGDILWNGKSNKVNDNFDSASENFKSTTFAPLYPRLKKKLILLH